LSLHDARPICAVAGGVVGLGGPGVGAVVRAGEGPGEGVGRRRVGAHEGGAVVELHAGDADVVGGGRRDRHGLGRGVGGRCRTRDGHGRGHGVDGDGEDDGGGGGAIAGGVVGLGGPGGGGGVRAVEGPGEGGGGGRVGGEEGGGVAVSVRGGRSEMCSGVPPTLSEADAVIVTVWAEV